MFWELGGGGGWEEGVEGALGEEVGGGAREHVGFGGFEGELRAGEVEEDVGGGDGHDDFVEGEGAGGGEADGVLRLLACDYHDLNSELTLGRSRGFFGSASCGNETCFETASRTLGTIII